MQADRMGHRVTTDSRDASTAFDRAIDSYVGWRTDIMDHIAQANEADPDFALPYAVKGIFMLGLRKPEIVAPATKLLAAAENARPPESNREHRYIEALAALINGEITKAVAHYEAIAVENPRDILALRLAQLELFWLGEVAWMRDISERAAPSWRDGDPRLGALHAVRAFGLEETGDYAAAERHGRAAIDLDPTDSWGAHAVAHVLVMQGRLSEGVAWLETLSGNWGDANHIRHHNWWHLALFHVEGRNYDAALEIYDKKLRDLDSPLMKAVPDFLVDIQNDVAILQRLELRGLDVGERWADIADLAAGRIGNHLSPFTSAHCALALAAAGRMDSAEELVRQMRAFAATEQNSLAPRYALAAIPAAEAAIAYRRSEYARVIDILMPARRNLWQMGGSHAQRDLFFQLLANSALKLGRKDILTVFFEEHRTIGFDHLEERSSYADALAFLQ